jgi:hypothetical protein
VSSLLNLSSFASPRLAHSDSNAQPFTIEFGPDVDGSPVELKGFPFVGAVHLDQKAQSPEVSRKNAP